MVLRKRSEIISNILIALICFIVVDGIGVAFSYWKFAYDQLPVMGGVEVLNSPFWFHMIIGIPIAAFVVTIGGFVVSLFVMFIGGIVQEIFFEEAK